MLSATCLKICEFDYGFEGLKSSMGKALIEKLPIFSFFELLEYGFENLNLNFVRRISWVFVVSIKKASKGAISPFKQVRKPSPPEARVNKVRVLIRKLSNPKSQLTDSLRIQRFKWYTNCFRMSRNFLFFITSVQKPPTQKSLAYAV